MIKTTKMHIFFIVVAVVSVLIIAGAAVSCNSGSGHDIPPGQASPKIIIEDGGDRFSIVGNNPVIPDSRGNATINLTMKGKYFVTAATNPAYGVDAIIEKDGGNDGVARILIRNVSRTVRIRIECSFVGAIIIYHPNGGESIVNGSTDEYAVAYSLKHHFRPNTEIGTDKITRDGFTQTGWNTEKDGNGEHIGLGSRVTAKEGKPLRLYAEWREWTDISSFTYRDVFGAGFSITGYSGINDVITVPGSIGGKKVETIAAGAFKGVTAQSIVLPKGLKNIAGGAFVNCSFKQLYLYDDIEEISDASFVNCPEFSTLHINAIEPPRYVTQDRHASLADKYDILILNQDEKKLVVLGGSGAYYSVDTMQIEQRYSDYTCINMAVNAWFNGMAQFEMILPYLREGDVFVHAPEASSPFQLMYQTGMHYVFPSGETDNRFFATLELNYDLFSSVDIRNITATFDAFQDYNDLRNHYEAGKYDDYIKTIDYAGGVYESDTGYIDTRGNYAPPKPAAGEHNAFGEADIVTGYIMDAGAIFRLNNYYDKIRAKGAMPYFINAAVNQDILLKRIIQPSYEPFVQSPHPAEFPITTTNYDYFVAEFDTAVDNNLSITNILRLTECLYPTSAFGGSDYHLSDAGTKSHTNKIIDALKSCLS